MTTFALIHSPLCGPATWQPVATQFHAHGHDVIMPRLLDDERLPQPLWQQQAASIADALKGVPAQQPIVWVAHSGAGLRLPAYRASVANPAAGYVFVDAGIPYDFPPQGMSQLDAMRRERGQFAEGLRAHLDAGGRFPEWTDEMLRDAIPDDEARAQTLREMQPRSLRYFEERIVVPANWPDAPCAFLHFSAGYTADADYARAQHWPVRKIDAGHFHMLVDPPAVAQVISLLAS